MIEDYKYEIIGAFLKFFGLFYFVMGFFTTYSWGCKELDFRSARNEVNNFWNPIASVSGCINIANFILVIFSIHRSRKYRDRSGEFENKILFFILYIPLFVAAIFYKILEIVKNFEKQENAGFLLFLSIGELFLFLASGLIIANINFYLWRFEDKFNKTLSRFAILVAFIGMMNYFIFHMASMQIFSFISIASDYKAYEQFYNKSVLDKYSDPIYFQNIRLYMLPIVTLFYCTSMVLLVKYLFSKQDHDMESECVVLLEVSGNELMSEGEIEPECPISNEGNSFNRKENTEIFSTFRLPPLSLIFAIFCITISLLMISIFDSISKFKSLFIESQYLASIFPIPFYLWSIFLLSMQIKEMERWSILWKNKNFVDISLIYLGAMGQLINAFSKIELEHFTDNITMGIIKGFSYGILIFQTMMQTMTVSLALNRKWMKQERKSWHEYICPPVGLVSINFSFLVFNIYLVMTNNTNKQFVMHNEKRLFLKLFGTGFHSLGESLCILQGLHLTLIFVKLIVYTIN